ncbi:unnamed protein product (macronuclear) [Paramecium tetraurelia]|uniref:Transmembrane protein n=1 Tax=Paramecium tetraurelia TaxID=5888 RepID=A0BM51_PARTE|nr:uncharacterized protein GSPATT00030252001 [Paramecium tetraurelia]CAK59618.1 unnamed protein product [Paramecium tetraurelia]|eukprot:XP_001427016.1 hypothetical protein (macronuclear) [Paramecium tetraurelia strain d4-2]
MILRIRNIYRFCSNNNSNYHKIVGSLPGQNNKDIKENLEKFSRIYQKVDFKQLQREQIDEQQKKFMLQNQEAYQFGESIQVGEKGKIGQSNYLKLMGVFFLGMFIYLGKETYKFFTNPRNVLLYDESTGKTYYTTKEEFEKIKAEQKRNKEFKEFRFKVLSKQQDQREQKGSTDSLF